MRFALLMVLSLFTFLFVVLAHRDLCKEWKVVFDRRLLSRYVTRFTLRTLFVVSSGAAVVFAFARVTGNPFVAFCLVAVFGGSLSLISVAVRDVFEPFAKHRYPEKIDFADQTTKASSE